MRTIGDGRYSLCNDCLAAVPDPELKFHQEKKHCPICGGSYVCQCPACVAELNKIYRGDETHEAV